MWEDGSSAIYVSAARGGLRACATIRASVLLPSGSWIRFIIRRIEAKRLLTTNSAVPGPLGPARGGAASFLVGVSTNLRNDWAQRGMKVAIHGRIRHAP